MLDLRWRGVASNRCEYSSSQEPITITRRYYLLAPSLVAEKKCWIRQNGGSDPSHIGVKIRGLSSNWTKNRGKPERYGGGKTAGAIGTNDYGGRIQLAAREDRDEQKTLVCCEPLLAILAIYALGPVQLTLAVSRIWNNGRL